MLVYLAPPLVARGSQWPGLLVPCGGSLPWSWSIIRATSPWSERVKWCSSFISLVMIASKVVLFSSALPPEWDEGVRGR